MGLPDGYPSGAFLASLHGGIETGVAGGTRLTTATDTTVHTLFGQQIGGRTGYNPKNKGKKSYQPILTFLGETREYINGELHSC
jgi:hypothetical protein